MLTSSQMTLKGLHFKALVKDLQFMSAQELIVHLNKPLILIAIYHLNKTNSYIYNDVISSIEAF